VESGAVGLDLRKIQHLVDYLQQMLPIVPDDSEILLDIVGKRPAFEQPRKSQDGVEWRTQFVTHVCQKNTLRPIGGLGVFFGHLEFSGSHCYLPRQLTITLLYAADAQVIRGPSPCQKKNARRGPEPPCAPPRWQNRDGNAKALFVPDSTVVRALNAKYVMARRDLCVSDKAATAVCLVPLILQPFQPVAITIPLGTGVAQCRKLE